ncbi:MAG TPA: heavy metal-responsive transcriptional regulator [Acidimicrobiales bacterium]
MRIGELAAVGGVTAKTIRYYEDIGVLDPPARTPSGYRNYSRAATDRLGFIRSAQAVGLTLGEIRGILALRDRGTTPCGHVLDLITAVLPTWTGASASSNVSEPSSAGSWRGRNTSTLPTATPVGCAT